MGKNGQNRQNWPKMYKNEQKTCKNVHKCVKTGKNIQKQEKWAKTGIMIEKNLKRTKKGRNRK